VIPPDHPRYRSLVARERIAECARSGVVSLEGIAAHGRGEAFDYLLGEKTTESALTAEKTAAAFLTTAKNPVISVNGNTAALAAGLIRDLQQTTGAKVEVNLFHRTEERVTLITRLLEDHGVKVLEGSYERLLPLAHDRALCLRNGIFESDVILVPLEDGDRCQALRAMGKVVLAIDLNPLSRTSRAASLPIIDELTRAIPQITRFSRGLPGEEAKKLIRECDNNRFLRSALQEIEVNLAHALD
jgi:4-phosphopantoate--beta-alanine ligase